MIHSVNAKEFYVHTRSIVQSNILVSFDLYLVLASALWHDPYRLLATILSIEPSFSTKQIPSLLVPP